jgi:hypothetical protein
MNEISFFAMHHITTAAAAAAVAAVAVAVLLLLCCCCCAAVAVLPHLDQHQLPQDEHARACHRKLLLPQS